MPKKPKKSQKIEDKKTVLTKKSRMNEALTWFSLGCAAECYLLIFRHYYVDGSPTQLIALYGALKYMAFAGVGVFAVGLLATILLHRKPGVARKFGQIVLVTGVFLAVSSVIMRQVYPNGTTLLCVLVPVAALMSLLWSVYDRECSYSLTILGLTVVALWICRKGINADYWRAKVMLGAGIYVAILAVVVLLVFKADNHGGMLGKLQLLPAAADCLPIYVACGLSVASLVLAMLSATLAYYAMWAVAVVIFAAAVYYTVRLL
jgi:hypothetical protein